MDSIRISTLRRMKTEGRKIACLTAYDAGFSQLLEAQGVPLILVGDSLGMVVQGRDSTLPVTMEDMIYHTTAVVRGSGSALVIADMPFGSYVQTDQGLANGVRLMQAGAQMVKLEGGNPSVLTLVGRLSASGIPVCAHLGLLPQSVHKTSGYRVQGREPEQAQTIRDAAQALENAGAELLVLECVPSELGAELSDSLTIPVIGIGAGPGCDGQVLVLYDMLGITPGPLPRFCRDFSVGVEGIGAAVSAFVAAVGDGSFPAPEHEYR